MLSAENRLRKKKDFEILFAKGKNVFDTLYGVRFRKNMLPVSRFAFVVGTKVSKSAVVRNRIRRRLREIIRHRIFSLESGYDVAFIARVEAKNASFHVLEERMDALLKKTPFLKKDV
ncbi:MAG: Ribonuclease P protein component [Candidatus Uhrbacteria bacterium GW2011_GWF2_41_16]|jgi:ribonuclease P protein component|uniref:Ribonuclease P protein component n=2 Tax=Candidatus Uhriibacteriota TaxID=1752732 RepID=A0A0G0V9W6_9BACT|nr:MAG: Ribonuclease P protein component [Candidatus Uhrbacteria bacterium GW2011_GWC2_41_11]KKR97803.1 MAG: Ribonuclease P protein component [Candidatus Uhrbacteria bacterium GW2011_GWF2_41_16]HBP00264.1 ribonuclease P protein component [Candidatus Uhrbacteria bacterium]